MRNIFYTTVLSALFALTASAQTIIGGSAPGLNTESNTVYNGFAEAPLVSFEYSDAGGILTRSNTSPIEGRTSYVIDGTSLGQIVKFKVMQVEQVSGDLCKYSFKYRGDGTGYKAFLERASSRVREDALVLTPSDENRTWAFFASCARTSAQDYIGLETTVANAASLKVDLLKAAVSQDRGNFKTPDTFTAFMAATTGVITRQTGALDWIESTCSYVSSAWECDLKPGMFVNKLNCQILAGDSVYAWGYKESLSSNSKIVFVTAGLSGPTPSSAVPVTISCTTTGSDNLSTTASLATSSSNWFIKAVQWGTSSSLSTTSTLTEIVNASGSIEPQPNLGSKPVGAACSSTNAPTAPSYALTTCAAGSEAWGLSFNVETPDVYKVCTGFYARQASNSGEVAMFYRLREFTSAGSFVSDGYATSVAQSYTSGSQGDGGNNSMYLCGYFNFSTTGVKVIKGMYHGSAGSFGSSIENGTKANYEAGTATHTITWEVSKVGGASPFGYVTGNNNTPGILGNIDSFSFTISGNSSQNTACSSGTCFLSQIGNAVTSVVYTGSGGVYTATFARTYSKLHCVGNGVIPGTQMTFWGPIYCNNCNTVSLSGSNSASAASTGLGTFICHASY